MRVPSAGSAQAVDEDAAEDAAHGAPTGTIRRTFCLPCLPLSAAPAALPASLVSSSLRLTEVRLPIAHAAADLLPAIAARLGVPPAAIADYRIARRGYDARKPAAIVFVYTLDVRLADPAVAAQLLARHAGDKHVRPSPDTSYRFVARARPGMSERPVVIGAGPCGLFAALILAQSGFRPIVLERGKTVRERTRDTFGFWRKQNPLDVESNVQFGEGGAGTFSDGKLYSQIKDPHHLGQKVLEELVAAGAPEEILYVSKPHIGTFRLVKVVENMRATIEGLGGEIRFGARVTGLVRDAGRIAGVTLSDGTTLATGHVVLAVGHSARDTFVMLRDAAVYLEAKPFSIGVRIEHPQSLIDRARLGVNAGHPLLGAADYRLVHHCGNGRSVYSFCMCPGGTVVAATSETGRVVTNGMSQYSRNERNANAAIVVGIDPRDYVVPDDEEGRRALASIGAQADGKPDVLAGVAFQRYWEARAFAAGGGTYAAPGQLLGDFLAGRPSREFGNVLPSYKPAVHLTDLADCLPGYAMTAIREALPAFGKQLRGFDLADAMLTGVETRTSSPVRIRRGADYQSLNTPGLYPAGEGAGYAGGILSAAVDGIEVAQAVALAMGEALAIGEAPREAAKPVPSVASSGSLSA